MNEEERYVNDRMTWFDYVCLWSWAVPVGMVFVLIGNGIAGEPLDRGTLLMVYLVSFAMAVILRGIVLQMRIKRLREEFWRKK